MCVCVLKKRGTNEGKNEAIGMSVENRVKA